MIETGIQGMLAIEAAPQQQEQLSISQHIDDRCTQVGWELPTAACTAGKLKDVGAVAGKIWCRERLLPSIEKQSWRSCLSWQDLVLCLTLAEYCSLKIGPT